MGRAGVADRHAHRALELIGEFDDALAPCRQAMDAVDEVLSVGRGEQRDEVVGRLERGGKERRAVELDHRAHIVAVRLPTLLDRRRRRRTNTARVARGGGRAIPPTNDPTWVENTREPRECARQRSMHPAREASVRERRSARSAVDAGVRVARGRFHLDR